MRQTKKVEMTRQMKERAEKEAEIKTPTSLTPIEAELLDRVLLLVG